MDTIKIRPIEKKDNKQIASVIREVLIELGVPKVGSAYQDASLDSMFETYHEQGSIYYVIEDTSTIIGGGGISQLDNYNEPVCELQKMYFSKKARGKGLGSQLIDYCLLQAKAHGYLQCYLETMPNMHAAQTLYKRKGFEYIDAPMGDTGHYACPVYMLKDLSS